LLLIALKQTFQIVSWLNRFYKWLLLILSTSSKKIYNSFTFSCRSRIGIAPKWDQESLWESRSTRNHTQVLLQFAWIAGQEITDLHSPQHAFVDQGTGH
jgi:hypothetical protein